MTLFPFDCDAEHELDVGEGVGFSSPLYTIGLKLDMKYHEISITTSSIQRLASWRLTYLLLATLALPAVNFNENTSQSVTVCA